MWEITHASKIKITPFYEEILGLKLRNRNWSWGAFDRTSNRVFLKVWKDQINKNKAKVYWKDSETRSPGKNERLEHLDKVQAGAKCFGVLCEMIEDRSGTRRIRDFDDEQLLLLGNISDEGHYKYARILRRFPVSELGVSTIIADIKKIELDNSKDPTTKQALVNARIGQGRFGSAVREIWNHRCAITGSSTAAALEASHIKRWADSNDNERLDPNNGVLLMANLHRLFDAGLISFDDFGKMLISSKLSKSERNLLGINGKKLSKKPSSETIGYLTEHRKKFLK
jgi:putative restriction endonuclease